MVENLLTLLMLILLQAVLGFDNLLYISIESKRVPKEKQALVRTTGIGAAIVLRILLLILLLNLFHLMEEWDLFKINWEGVITGHFNFHALIVMLGGAFIMYTATKEILHMLSLEDDPQHNAKPQSTVKSIILIAVMNVVFSFDSILSAIALTETVWVMSTAIVVGGILMIVLSGKISEFLQKNRMYEVLGLFILFVVGIMLLTGGAEHADLTLLGNEVHEMSKTTFYFVIVVLVLVDLVQSRYQKKLQQSKVEGELLDQEQMAAEAAAETTPKDE